MKIICIGRNYLNHAKELGNQVPDEPVLFIKPASSFNRTNQFAIPKFSSEIHFELELVLKINKTGKNISCEDAGHFYDEIGLGIDFTARDLQSKLKTKGLPWEKAKGFDDSAAVSEFIPISSLKNSNEILFELYLNQKLQQTGNSNQMLFDFDQVIAHASQFFTLEKGDLIFTGTPEGVGKINSGDVLKGFLEGQQLLEVFIQ